MASRNDPPEPFYQFLRVEVHDQTDWEAGSSKVRQHLPPMKRADTGDRLDLDDDQTFHNQVDALTWNRPLPILHTDGLLALELHASQIQFQAKRSRVDGFLESGTEFRCTVNPQSIVAVTRASSSSVSGVSTLIPPFRSC